AVGAFDAAGYVAIVIVDLVNLLHALDIVFSIAHLLVHQAQLVENLFLGGVHGGNLAGGGLVLGDGHVEHAFFAEAFAEKVHGAQANVGVLLAALQGGNGFGDL